MGKCNRLDGKQAALGNLLSMSFADSSDSRGEQTQKRVSGTYERRICMNSSPVIVSFFVDFIIEKSVEKECAICHNKRRIF